jgi:DNA ligase (NAD+)
MTIIEQPLLLSESLLGKSIVVSGSFGTPQRRKELEALVVQHGAKLSGSVTSKTNFVVAGENMGPEKRLKAENMGIKILTEAEFLQLIAQ